jgi:hypothetical protein
MEVAGRQLHSSREHAMLVSMIDVAGRRLHSRWTTCYADVTNGCGRQATAEQVEETRSAPHGEEKVPSHQVQQLKPAVALISRTGEPEDQSLGRRQSPRSLDACSWYLDGAPCIVIAACFACPSSVPYFNTSHPTRQHPPHIPGTTHFGSMHSSLLLSGP